MINRKYLINLPKLFKKNVKLTGKIRPREEKPNAPINLINGPIDGIITANITAEIASIILQKKKSIFYSRLPKSEDNMKQKN